MKITVYASRELVAPRLFAQGSAVLLEGDWPSPTPGCLRASLDEIEDVRFGQIDVLAADLAAKICEIERMDEGPLRGSGLYSSADLNAWALRYYLARLVRIVIYFTQIRPLQSDDELRLVLMRGRDDDLADLFRELAARGGASCEIKWSAPPAEKSYTRTVDAFAARDVRPDAFPHSGRSRRLAVRLARLVEPRRDLASHRQRVVLCGSHRLLRPIAEELLDRGCQLWWLYDRFAFGPWLRWRRRGVGQLFCNASPPDKNRLSAELPVRLSCLGINLAPAVGRWMAERLERCGRQQTRLVREISSHFRRVRPHRVVFSEEATPFARAAIGVARLHGATSFTLQHDVPCCRLDFAPLAADHFLAWGRTSKEQLVDWGVPPEKVHLAGSPQYEGIFKRLHAGAAKQPAVNPVSADATIPHQENNNRNNGRDGSTTRIIWGKTTRANGLLRRLAWREPSGRASLHAARQLLRSDLKGQRIRSPKILLLVATSSPAARPDSPSLRLSADAHAKTLQMALAAVATIEGASLEIKLQQRDSVEQILNSLLRQFPSLPVSVTRKATLQECVARADCVLSLLSTAAVVAAAAGTPVIELLPHAALSSMPRRHWGMLASARTQNDLQRLLSKVLLPGWKSTAAVDEDVFANLHTGATAAAVDAILNETPFVQQPLKITETANASRSLDVARLEKTQTAAGSLLSTLRQQTEMPL